MTRGGGAGKAEFPMGTHPRLSSGRNGDNRWVGLWDLRPKEACASFLRQPQDHVEKGLGSVRGAEQVYLASLSPCDPLWPRSSRRIASTCSGMERDEVPDIVSEGL